jgi:hypothetical protein
MHTRLTENQRKRRICRCVDWLGRHGEAALPYNDLRFIALAHGQTFWGFGNQVFSVMMQRGLIEYADEGQRRFRLTELGRHHNDEIDPEDWRHAEEDYDDPAADAGDDIDDDGELE